MHNYILIVGVNEEGKQFRPRDWAARICDILASYGGSDGTTQYHRYCVPTSWTDYTAVRVDAKTETKFPQFWKFVMGFARDNNLKIIEHRSETINEPNTLHHEQRLPGHPEH